MLKGKNINIRPMSHEDVDIFYKWQTTQEHMGPFMGAQLHYKENFAEGIKKMFQDHNAFITIIEDKEGKPIGVLNYNLVRQGLCGIEIGMLIAEEDYRGKGIGKEALAMFVDYLFTSKPYYRILYETRVDNIAMKNIGEKLGFKVEGVMKGYMYDQGSYRDYYLLAITREDWLKHSEVVR